eukprot:9252559-Prorocentrum_lima.AAC.1
MEKRCWGACWKKKDSSCGFKSPTLNKAAMKRRDPRHWPCFPVMDAHDHCPLQCLDGKSVPGRK